MWQVVDGAAWVQLARVEGASIARGLDAAFPKAGSGIAVGPDGRPMAVPDQRGAGEKFLTAVAELEAAHKRIDDYEEAICRSVEADWVASDALRGAFLRACAAAPLGVRRFRESLGDLSDVARDRARRGTFRAAPVPENVAKPEWDEFRSVAAWDVERAGRTAVAWLKSARLAAVAADLDPSSEPWTTVSFLAENWRAALRRIPLDRLVRAHRGHEGIRFEWTGGAPPSDMVHVWPGTLGADVQRVVDDPVAAALSIGATDVVSQGGCVVAVASGTTVLMPLTPAGREAFGRLVDTGGPREEWHVRPDAIPGLQSTAGLRCARRPAGAATRYSFRFLSRQGWASARGDERRTA